MVPPCSDKWCRRLPFLRCQVKQPAFVHHDSRFCATCKKQASVHATYVVQPVNRLWQLRQQRLTTGVFPIVLAVLHDFVILALDTSQPTNHQETRLHSDVGAWQSAATGHLVSAWNNVASCRYSKHLGVIRSPVYFMCRK